MCDDSEEIRKQLKWGLGKDYEVLPAKDGREALLFYRRHHPKVVMLDLGLPPDAEGTDEGFRCLEEFLKISADTKVIVVTGNDERENALKAVQLGAYDFYQKPVKLNELRIIISRAFHLFDIEEENRGLHKALGKKAELAGVIGQCPEMLEVFSTIRRVASSDASILIAGESGTGKEMISRAIHSNFIPLLEAGINDIILISAGIFFLVSAETRIKHRRVLNSLHRLRVFAHIIDMHHLHKDPKRILQRGEHTPSTPQINMTSLNLTDTLIIVANYCR